MGRPIFVSQHLRQIRASARVKDRRVVRNGLDAWQLIHKAQSFESWKRIGAALAIGKAHTLNVTRANRAEGSRYCKSFSEWMEQNGFGKMPSSTCCH
jgi:hypothetical protein